ncbi:MAG: hypothetical protein AAB370_10535 [Verrucomicrobiota bacterium]
MNLHPIRHTRVLCHRLAGALILLLFALLLNQSASAQGPLTNGFTHTGTLSTSEQETWTFAANSGDGILIKLGEAVVGSSLYPRLRLYGPGSVLLSENMSPTAAEVTVRATNSGTFTVVIANADSVAPGGNGGYRLTLAKTGTAVFVASFDEGGPMTNSVVYVATNGIAGLDLWTFNACPGDGLALQITELTGGSSFSPELILYAPDGTLLNRVSGTTSAQINRAAPLPGNYLLIVGDTVGGYGTYQLTGSGFATGFKLCQPQINGANLVVGGVGGRAGSNYVMLATTNIALPVNAWTPIRTNQFGTFGECSVTNLFNAGVPQQYFRIRTP